MLKGKKIVGTIAYMGGVPSLFEQFCWSWSQMIQYNNDYFCEPGEMIQYDRATVSYHAYARNTLINRLRGDWILFLDTDHKFEPDLAARMIHKMYQHDVKVLTGLYQYKQHPFMPVLYRSYAANKNDKNSITFEPIGAWDKAPDIFEVGSAGAGCLLIHKDVIRRIQKELKEEPFDIIPPFSEDHSFFKRLKKLKIKSYCDPKIECNHLAIKPVTLKDYDKTGLKLSKRYTVEGRKYGN